MSNADVVPQIEGLLDRVESIMERDVVVLSPDESLGDAARALERAEISGAPVVAGSRLVGMVSLADLFRGAGIRPEDAATSGPWHRHEHAMAQSGRTVAQVMNTKVVTLPPEASITRAAAAMSTQGVNRIPVLDRDGAVIGIVARDDIIDAVARTTGGARTARSSKEAS